MIEGFGDVDYRTKRFSCSRCGAEACMCLAEPIKETGIEDFRPDEIEQPETIQEPSPGKIDPHR